MGYRNSISVTPKKNTRGEIVRGKWLVVVSRGFDGNGKRIRKKLTVSGTKAEAYKRGEEIKREFESGIDPNADKITFTQFTEEWHANRVAAGELAKASLEHEEYRLSRLNEELGAYTLKQINPVLIERAYRNIKTNPRTGNAPLSGTTMNGFHRLLSQVMKDAWRKGFTLNNPCDLVDAPRRDTKEKAFLSRDRAAQLADIVRRCIAEEFEAVKAKEAHMTKLDKKAGRSAVRGISRIGNLIALWLGLVTGMRKEEVLGLIWANVSPKCDSVKVVQTHTKQGHIGKPKTAKSKRTIALDSETAKLLTQWRKAQFLLLLSLKISNFNAVPVCCSDTATYCNHANYDRWLKEWTKAHGFGGLTFHQLRHTNATLLLNNPRVTLKQVQRRLGHSQASTTLDTYGHFIEETDEHVAVVIGDILTAKTA